MHFRPRISSIWMSLAFAFFIATLGLGTRTAAQSTHTAQLSGVATDATTWQDGVPAFVQGGAKAMEEWLQTNGVTASELPLTKAARHKGGGRL
jgi:hypothetical protein